MQAGKNLLPITIDQIKALNRSGAWNGNVYTHRGGTFTVVQDANGNVTEVIVDGTFSSNTSFILCNIIIPPGDFRLTGCPSGGGTASYRLRLTSNDFGNRNDYGAGLNFHISNYAKQYQAQVFINSAVEVTNISFKPMVCIASDTDETWEYYAGATYTITFPSEAGTVYGGTLDVTNGTLMVTEENIANYDGETLPGEWISDRDVYSAGATPTTGAQVVYKLSNPIAYQLTPQQIELLAGVNNIWHDANGDTELTYYAE